MIFSSFWYRLGGMILIDQAGFMMASGKHIAIERIQGINDNMLKSHYHDYFELYYLENGKRYHMIDDKIYCIQSGEFIIFPPYSMHHSYGDNDVPFKRLVLYFTPDCLQVKELLRNLSSSSKVYKSQNNYDIHFILKQILKEQEDALLYSNEAIQSLLNQLLIKIVRHVGELAEPEKQNRITEIIYYLHQHYTENITLENLAATFYISPYYLCREFKRYTNTTIIQYINNIRISQAQRMLLETNKNITDISKSVGFSNITHFGRVFKAITGMSPSKNKRQAAVMKTSVIKG
jgi:AraC-like DNA-binding protein/quercetin dioxygenase-like cupin family protein